MRRGSSPHRCSAWAGPAGRRPGTIRNALLLALSGDGLLRCGWAIRPWGPRLCRADRTSASVAAPSRRAAAGPRLSARAVGESTWPTRCATGCGAPVSTSPHAATFRWLVERGVLREELVDGQERRPAVVDNERCLVHAAELASAMQNGEQWLSRERGDEHAARTLALQAIDVSAALRCRRARRHRRRGARNCDPRPSPPARASGGSDMAGHDGPHRACRCGRGDIVMRIAKGPSLQKPTDDHCLNSALRACPPR